MRSFPLVVVFPFLVLPALAQELPPDPRDAGSHVADWEDVFEAEAETRLDEAAKGMAAELAVDLVVVTTRTSGESKAEATRLFEGWGLADTEGRDGLLILLDLGQQRMEMEGTKPVNRVLTYEWTDEMQKTEMIPAFAAGRYAEGVEAGIAAIDAELRRARAVEAAPAPIEAPRPPEAPAAAEAPPEPEPPAAASEGDPDRPRRRLLVPRYPLPTYGGIGFLLGLLVGGGVVYRLTRASA